MLYHEWVDEQVKLLHVLDYKAASLEAKEYLTAEDKATLDYIRGLVLDLKENFLKELE